MSSSDNTLNRRDFLIKSSLGSLGIMIGTACNPMRRAIITQVTEKLEPSFKNKLGPMVWFEVTKANEVILHSPKVEMGQGIFTGFAQIVAEEIEIDVNRVQVVNASTKDRPVDPRSTGGSDSTGALYNTLRELAANMREMLRNNAATIIGAPAESLKVENGTVSGGGKTLTYGEIVEQSTEWKTPKKVTLKTKDQFKVIGKTIPRVDLKPKVMGEPIYGLDVSMPDMLYGSVVRCPHVDAQMISADTSVAEQMPGVVKIIREAGFIGVIATGQFEADLAKSKIKVEWKINKKWQTAELLEMTKIGYGKPFVVQRNGSIKKQFESENTLESEFTTPFGTHAQIEPNGAVAFVEKDRATLKLSTQVQRITRDEVAEALGFKPDQVEVQATYLGGGFGRRLYTPNAIQAALMSRAVGKPVHVFFSRQEEFQNGTYRPATHHKTRAEWDENKNLVAFEHHTSSGDVTFGSALIPKSVEGFLGADVGSWIGGLNNYHKIPNYETTAWRVENMPIDTNMWRSLGTFANTFAIESFWDELAHKMEVDPVELRLKYLPDHGRGERLKHVIRHVAEKTGWGKKLPAGKGMGIACTSEFGTSVATVVELTVKGKDIQIDKATCVIDCGIAVNPDGVKAQCESAITMGMSAAMFEKIEVVDGQVQPIIYGPYKVGQLKHAPRDIEVIVMDSNERPSGVGEPPMGPPAPAIANAIFNATGKRLRDMPLQLS